MTLTFLFVYCFLFVNYYSKILLQLCRLYSTGHFIAELTLYQMLESGKDTSLHRPDDRGNDTVWKECKGSTELVIKMFIANKIHDVKGGPCS